MDEEKRRRMEMDFFQGNTGPATDAALELLSGLDLDDDDDAAMAADIVSRGLTSSDGSGFASRLAESGFDFGTRFPDGQGLVTIYASRGRSDPAVYSALRDAGADLCMANRNGSTALHILASLEKSPWSKDREADMADIVRLSDDVSAWMVCDTYGATPLHLAVLNRHHELVKALLDAGANPGATGTSIREGYGHAVDFGRRCLRRMHGLQGSPSVASRRIPTAAALLQGVRQRPGEGCGQHQEEGGAEAAQRHRFTGRFR